jgi:hypothetical protein
VLGEDDGGATHLDRALRQDHAEFSEQTADAIDSGGALLDVALAHAVQREDGLLR